jgi:hypothetical protein
MRSQLVLGFLLALGLTAMAAPAEPPVDPKTPKMPPAGEPKIDMPPGDVDVAKTTERIVQDANEAGKRLGAKDPGDDTQRLQQEIVKNIDALIRKAQEPPPPKKDDSSDSSNNSGMGKGDSSSKPKEGGSQSSQNRKERREKQQASKKQGTQPLPAPRRGDQQSGGSSDRLGKMDPSLNRIEPKGALPHLPDAYKDVWGHLPEKMRMEMDLYFREQFMPRYSELLKQYYSSLSERGGKTGSGP